VPRTVVGGVVVEGVDEERIKQLCRIGQIKRQLTLSTAPPSYQHRL